MYHLTVTRTGFLNSFPRPVAIWLSENLIAIKKGPHSPKSLRSYSGSSAHATPI